MKLSIIFTLMVIVWSVQSQTFLFTKFSDSMQDEFLDRKNGVTLSNPNKPNTIYVGYGTPGNDSKVTLVMQKFSPFTTNSFPAQPLETLYASGSKYGPQGDNVMLATYVIVGSQEQVFLASKLNGGMALTRWIPNSNSSVTLMDYSYADTAVSWSDASIQGNSTFTAIQAQFMSIAVVANTNDSIPLVAVAINFDAVFRVLIFKLYPTYTALVGVVDSSPPPDKTVGAVSLMSFNGGKEFLLGFAVEQSVNVWEARLQVIDQDFNTRDYLTINGTTILDFYDMQLHPSSISGYFFITAQLANTTHTMIKRILVQEIDANKGVVSQMVDVVAIFNSNSFVSATNLLSSGEMVTVWVKNSDDTYIYGHSKNYRPDKPAAFTFQIPAATSTSAIDSLIVTPMSDATFAITQVVRGSSPSSFVNYYVLSNCGDSTITPNENCDGSNDGCIQCMCSTATGWYSTGDGLTCMTSCGDGIIAGNETCDNDSDPNCVNCICANGTEWNTNQKLCLVPGQASPVSGVVGPENASPTTGAVPFDNKLIAAIVCAPVGAGAIIFLAVFFGRRNAKKKKDKKNHEGDLKDDLPLKPLDSARYSSVEAISVHEARTNDVKYGAINTTAPTPQKSVDKMNVPYTDLKFIKEIGSGAYGKVYIGEWQRTKVALKINTLASGDEFAREAKLMVDLRPHPNVVQMLGVSSDGPYPVMILEFCDGGSLDTKLFHESQGATLSEQLTMISGIAKGLYHLHKNQIVHRDLAARNILLNFNQPKISDFGLSRFVNDTQKGTTRSNVGPIRWMSPESLKNQIYSPKSDVWSFGMVVYEIVARKEPHAEADQMAIGLQIRDNGITPEIPEDCDPCLAELLKKCWQLDPELRPTMEEVCDMIDHYMQEKNL